MKIKILLLFFVAVVFICRAQGQEGDFGLFNRSLNNTAHGYQIVIDPTGSAPTKQVEAFEVRPGDCFSNSSWNDCRSDRERSELSEANKNTVEGDEYWYSWSFYLAKDFPNISPTKATFGQFHQRSSHPIWMFEHNKEGLYLTKLVSGVIEKYALLAEDTLRGKWHKIEIHVKWSKDKDGFFNVWLDTVRKVSFQGQTMDAKNVYFKYGLYRAFLSRYQPLNIQGNLDAIEVPKQKIYYANVKRATSRKGLTPLIEH
ncbi:MAG: polysaccharide lyase [Bermanella sp.]